MTVTFENGMLKVLLSKDETITYNIDKLFQNTDKKSAEIALALLYKEALQKVSSSLRFDRLIIEVFPFFGGGCEVTFTPDKPRVPVAIKDKRTCVITAEFPDSESMIKGILVLYRSKFRETAANLYTKNKVYRLLLFPTFGLKQLYNLLSHTSCTVTTSLIYYAATSEHWQPLCQKTAIKTLGSAFFRDF